MGFLLGARRHSSRQLLEKTSVFIDHAGEIQDDVSFGQDGEWAKSRVLQVQFHEILGHGLEQFRNAGTVETILTPSEYKTGNVVYPYGEAKKSYPYIIPGP